MVHVVVIKPSVDTIEEAKGVAKDWKKGVARSLAVWPRRAYFTSLSPIKL